MSPAGQHPWLKVYVQVVCLDCPWRDHHRPGDCRSSSSRPRLVHERQTGHTTAIVRCSVPFTVGSVSHAG